MFKRFMFGYKYGREIIKINFCFIIEIKKNIFLMYIVGKVFWFYDL